LGVPMARPDCTARILSGSHVLTPILDPGRFCRRWYMKRWPSGPSAVPVCWTNRKKAYTPPTQEVRRTTAASVTSAAFRGGIHVVSECITDNQGADCRLESTWPLAIAAPAPW
jgi:hypothetical protein